MATEDLKRQIAFHRAQGMGTKELANRFDYTDRGMRKILASPDVQSMIAQEREALREHLNRYRARLILMGDQAVANVEAVIESPGHSKCVDTSRWLLDKTALRPDPLQVNLEVASISPETAQKLTEGLRDLVQQIAEAGPPPPLEEHLIQAGDSD